MLGLSANRSWKVSRMTPSLDELVKQGQGAQDAVDLGDGIFMSRNIANSYLVTSPDGARAWLAAITRTSPAGTAPDDTSPRPGRARDAG